MCFAEQIPKVNIQAFVALLLFFVSLLLARFIVRITKGELPCNAAMLIYLRMLLGFVFAASIALGLYSFMGIYVLDRIWF